MHNQTMRFPIGTQFKTRGKHPRLATVIDYLVTTNLAGADRDWETHCLIVHGCHSVNKAQ